MPKIKTKKTLIKRIKITKGGKILKNQNDTGHLKRKWSVSRKHRKNRVEEVGSAGYIYKIKKMIGKVSKGL